MNANTINNANDGTAGTTAADSAPFDLSALEEAPVTSYISSIISPDASLVELEDTLSRLVSHLELSCSDATASVSALVSSVSKTVPALSFDLQLVREHALMLRFSLQSLQKQRSSALTDSPQEDHERISALFTAQRNLSASLDILRQAETWTSLDSDVSSLLSAGDFAKAANRLADASNTLSLFSNTPEYEPRKSLLVSLQNSLEAHLVTGLVKSIGQRDTRNVRAVGDILREAGREDEFRAYYFGSRRSDAVNSWKSARLVDCVSNDNGGGGSATETLAINDNQQVPPVNNDNMPVTFSVWLSTWTKTVLDLVSDEITLIPAIFPDPFETLSVFLTSTFDSLTPSLSQRLSDVSSHHGSRALLEFIKLYHMVEQLVLAANLQAQKLKPSPPSSVVKQATTKPSSSSASSPTPSGRPSLPSLNTSLDSSDQQQQPMSASATMQSNELTPNRRRRSSSKRFSISRRLSTRSVSFGHGSSYSESHQPQDSAVTTPFDQQQQNHQLNLEQQTIDDNEPIPAWETSLLEPFLEWQVEYTELESRLLDELSNDLLNSLAQQQQQQQQQQLAKDDYSSANLGTGQSRNLWEVSVSLFALADEALGRCMAFTHGYGAASFVDAVDSILVKFFKKCSELLIDQPNINSRRRSPANENNINSNNSNNNNGGFGSPTSSSFGLDGLDYTSDDWATFRLGLRLLRTCRSMSEKLNSLDHRVRTRLSIIAPTIRDGLTVPGTTTGAISLLRQSTLNSFELRQLLDLVNPQQHHHHQQQQQQQLQTSFPPSSSPIDDQQPRSRRQSLSMSLSNSTSNQLSTSLGVPPASRSRRRSSNASHSSHNQGQQGNNKNEERLIFERARRSSKDLAKSCQKMVHDTILGPLLSSLVGYEHLPVWKNASANAPSTVGSTGGGSGDGSGRSTPGPSFDLSIPTFSLSPTEPISRLSEGLFNLPRLFEVYAADEDSLSFSIETLPFYDVYIAAATSNGNNNNNNNEQQQQQDQPTTATGMDASTNSTNTRRRQSILGGGNNNDFIPPKSPTGSSSNIQLSAEAVISSWLSSLTLSALDNLVAQHLNRISGLSERGARQLSCDLSHIANVAKAFEVESPSHLRYWLQALEYMTNNKNATNSPGMNSPALPTTTISSSSSSSSPASTPRLDSNNFGAIDDDNERQIWQHVSRLINQK